MTPTSSVLYQVVDVFAHSVDHAKLTFLFRKAVKYMKKLYGKNAEPKMSTSVYKFSQSTQCILKSNFDLKIKLFVGAFEYFSYIYMR